MSFIQFIVAYQAVFLFSPYVIKNATKMPFDIVVVVLFLLVFIHFVSYRSFLARWLDGFYGKF